MQDVVSVGRAVMLFEPLAEDFNNLLMEPPVRRIMTVAQTLRKAAEINDQLGQIIRESGAMAVLHDEGKARNNGEVVVPKAFIPDFDRAAARETSNA